ncbi:MAG: non-canonical purine NTP pyrophosphatase [Candidatus Diapherotrites archaeon]
MKNKSVIFVSKNRYKFEEMNNLLSKYGISLSMNNLEVPENAEGTITDVAIDKAKKAYALVKKPLIIEDTGVFFDDYNDFPGINAKRAYLQLGFTGLLALAKATKTKKAHFTTVVCYIWGPNKYKTFVGKMSGTLLTKLSGKEKDVLPYEKFFVPEGHKKSLSHITREEKNKFSHRAKATEKFGKWYAQK